MVARFTTSLVQRGVSADKGAQAAARLLFVLIGIFLYVVFIEPRR
jgi:hypothetical protein